MNLMIVMNKIIEFYKSVIIDFLLRRQALLIPRPQLGKEGFKNL
jgi:hypothetical protein